MVKHIIFIFIYIAFFNVFSAEVILLLLMLHCVIGAFETIKRSKASLLTIIYATALFSTYCNILLVLNPDATTQSVYKYIVPKYIPQAALIWCIGNTLLFMGYEAFANKSFPDISLSIKKKHLIIIFTIVLSLNILGFSGYSINFSFLGEEARKL